MASWATSSPGYKIVLLVAVIGRVSRRNIYCISSSSSSKRPASTAATTRHGIKLPRAALRWTTTAALVGAEAVVAPVLAFLYLRRILVMNVSRVDSAPSEAVAVVAVEATAETAVREEMAVEWRELCDRQLLRRPSVPQKTVRAVVVATTAVRDPRQRSRRHLHAPK